MSLRRRLGYLETPQEFILAAEDRYFEGLELLARGHGSGGIYLLGYTAEMLLKVAFFRIIGSRLTDPVQMGVAQARANALNIAVQRESYHSLQFWSALIRAERARARRPLDRLTDAVFVQRTRRLYQNWWVSMRYRRSQSTTREATTVLDDVSWLRANSVRLWS